MLTQCGSAELACSTPCVSTFEFSTVTSLKAEGWWCRTSSHVNVFQKKKKKRGVICNMRSLCLLVTVSLFISHSVCQSCYRPSVVKLSTRIRRCPFGDGALHKPKHRPSLAARKWKKLPLVSTISPHTGSIPNQTKRKHFSERGRYLASVRTGKASYETETYCWGQVIKTDWGLFNRTSVHTRCCGAI